MLQINEVITLDLVIVGAGGLAKEIIFMVERNDEYNIEGLVDDNCCNLPEKILGYPILGGLDYLYQSSKSTAVVIGIASPETKKTIYNNLKENKNLFFPNIIDNTALIGRSVIFGIGNIIMPYTTFTSSINIGDFNMINIHATIGHDVKIKDYNSFYPSVNISGNTVIESLNEFGVGAKVIQNLQIGDENIIGAGAVVIRSVGIKSKLVGVPAKIIESWD